jgi:hypothetical protein
MFSEPPWMPRTEEEYRQQLAADDGPQPDEMVRLQQALDAAEEEVARLQMVRDAAEREIERLKEALRLVYGYAAAIQRMSVFAPIGFRCSLIRETVGCALPDDEAKRLHDETGIILDAFTGE